MFDQVQALDVIGPGDAFSIAASLNHQGAEQPGYEVRVVGLSNKPVRTESGLILQPQTTIRNAPAFDTIMVPGGKGLRFGNTSSAIASWILARAEQTRRIASVCTGIYALAPTGLLDGRRVTTHWRFAETVARRFPKLNVDPNALFLKDGPFYTAGGITASIDLSLALIEEDYGSRIALSVARELVVYLKRPGGQKQYSEPLAFQMNSTDRFSELGSWILNHLRENLSLDRLATQACLSSRHFSRRFKGAFGGTPASFVENLRLDEARRRLTESRDKIDSVAASVGFQSDDSFRRAFERRFGINPSHYRRRFDVQAAESRNGEARRRRSKRSSR